MACSLTRRLTTGDNRRLSPEVVGGSAAAGAATGAGATQGAYAASKGGLNTLMKNLANEWASKGVRVNGVAPGLVDTEMWEPTFERLGEESVREGFVKRVPLARWGTADEIANVACFLASTEASYVTGQTIRVDGGMTNI